MCLEYKDILKRIQNLEDTVADTVEEMKEHTYDSVEMDILFDKLEKYERLIEDKKQELLIFDKWCQNHMSITKGESQEEWYKECSNQLKLDLGGD